MFLRTFGRRRPPTSTIFKVHKWLADPFALALIFPPFGIKHQNGITFGALTPLPHQNVKLKRRGNENTKRNLGQDTFYRNAVEALSLSSSLSLSMFLRDYFKCTQTNRLVLKESSCSTYPPKHVHYLHRDL
jgi:hypothetical protein